MIENFEHLLDAALHVRDKRVVVVFPNNSETFEAVEQAAEMGLAEFILVGDDTMIRRFLDGKNGQLSNIGIVPESRIVAMSFCEPRS